MHDFIFDRICDVEMVDACLYGSLIYIWKLDYNWVTFNFFLKFYLHIKKEK